VEIKNTERGSKIVRLEENEIPCCIADAERIIGFALENGLDIKSGIDIELHDGYQLFCHPAEARPLLKRVSTVRPNYGVCC